MWQLWRWDCGKDQILTSLCVNLLSKCLWPLYPINGGLLRRVMAGQSCLKGSEEASQRPGPTGVCWDNGLFAPSVFFLVIASTRGDGKFGLRKALTLWSHRLS